MFAGIAPLCSVQLEAELAVICLLGVDAVWGSLAWLGLLMALMSYRLPATLW